MAVFADTVTRDKLAIAHLSLVAPIARALARRLPPAFPADDLEGEGHVALLRAAASFDSSRGVSFSLYARYRVREAMLDSVRRRNWAANTCQPLAEAPEPFYAPGIDEQIDRETDATRIFAAIEHLPGRQREIVRALRSGAGVADIAARLDVSTATVWADRRAALTTIRAALAGESCAPRRLSVVASKKNQPVRPDLAAAANARLAAEVDELGALEKELAPWKPKIARIEALRKSVRARYDAAPAGDTFEAVGQRFVVVVGARANESVIDYAKLLKAIGAKLFCQIAKTTLKALEEHVPCSVRAEVVTVEACGSRSLKTFERGTPELPKAA